MTSRRRKRVEATSVASLETDEQAAQRIAALLAETLDAEAAAVSLADAGGGRWRVAIHFCDAPDGPVVRALVASAAGKATARALRWQRLAAKHWVEEGLTGLAPVRAGRFVVHGGHDRARVARNRIGIEIEAALAFGTGHHGTTRGCLLALEQICKKCGRPKPACPHPEVLVAQRRASKDDGPRASARILRGSLRSHLRMREGSISILDLGTGSGVLAIAAARALRRRALATDIDPKAVRVARGNARLNRVAALVEVIRAGGVNARHLQARAPFDLIFANILLGPLQRLAAPLTKLVAPGARVVLSGLLAFQANAALAAYRGLALERRIDLDGWTTLILRRR